MQTRGRFGLAGWQKAILWIGLLVCVWRFVQVPQVFEAIVNFYAAGEVPGTAIVLSPDAALWFMCGAFLLGALIIFIRLFIFRPKRMPPTVTYNVPVMRAAAPSVVGPIKGNAKAPKAVRRMRRLQAAGIRMVRALRVKVARLVHRFGLSVRRAYTVSTPYVRRIAIVSMRYIVQAMAFVALVLVAAWDATRPYIHRFDAFLAAKLNQNEVSSALLGYGRRVVTFVSDLWRRAA